MYRCKECGREFKPWYKKKVGYVYGGGKVEPTYVYECICGSIYDLNGRCTGKREVSLW